MNVHLPLFHQANRLTIAYQGYHLHSLLIPFTAMLEFAPATQPAFHMSQTLQFSQLCGQCKHIFDTIDEGFRSPDRVFARISVSYDTQTFLSKAGLSCHLCNLLSAEIDFQEVEDVKTIPNLNFNVFPSIKFRPFLVKICLVSQEMLLSIYLSCKPLEPTPAMCKFCR